MSIPGAYDLGAYYKRSNSAYSYPSYPAPYVRPIKYGTNSWSGAGRLVNGPKPLFSPDRTIGFPDGMYPDGNVTVDAQHPIQGAQYDNYLAPVQQTATPQLSTVKQEQLPYVYQTPSPEVTSTGAQTLPTKYQLPEWASTGGAILGGIGAVGGLLGAALTKNQGYDEAMNELDRQYNMYNNPNSDWYKSAWERYRQAFTDASPTLDTLTGAGRAAGIGAQSASYLGRAQAQEQARKNRGVASDMTRDLYLQGRDYANQLRLQKNQLMLDKQQNDASFWEQVAGSGIGLLGLVL